MKNYVKGFLQRGLISMGCGPLVMAVIYGILDLTGVVDTVSVTELVRVIFTSSLLAFIAAGITVVYEIDRLPLMAAIGLHAGVLYLDYIGIYLFNGWLQNQLKPILIFTGSYTLGFILIWLLIWLFTRSKTHAINQKMNRSK